MFSFIKMVPMKISVVLTVYFLLMLSAYAADEGQNLDGQIQDNQYFQDLLQEEDLGEAYSIPNQVKAQPEFDNAVQAEEEKPLEKKEYFQSERASTDMPNSIPGLYEKSNQYLEFEDSKSFNEVARDGSATFGIGYMVDNFDYKDPRGVHKRTYESQSGSRNLGALQVAMKKYIWRSGVEGFWGANIGLGQQSGKGHFPDGSESYAEFQLWSIPLDASFGVAVPLGNWAKISLEGGPSVMGLLQSRSDKESGEKHKRRRQIGTGYFAEGKFGLSLARIFPGLGRSLFTHYKGTQFFLNFVMRAHNYSNFQDDIEISGSSYGIQFNLEYL